MKQFIADLQAICRQYGHKVDTINPSIDSDGKIQDITIYMDEDEGPMFNISDNEGPIFVKGKINF